MELLAGISTIHTAGTVTTIRTATGTATITTLTTSTTTDLIIITTMALAGRIADNSAL